MKVISDYIPKFCPHSSGGDHTGCIHQGWEAWGFPRILPTTLHWLSTNKNVAVGFSAIKQSRSASKEEASKPCMT